MTETVIPAGVRQHAEPGSSDSTDRLIATLGPGYFAGAKFRDDNHQG